MKPFLLHILIFLAILGVASCSNDIREVDELFYGVSEEVEMAKDVEMLYSDSAIVKVRIKAPTLLTHISRTRPDQEFPDGLRVEFLNKNKRVYSWMRADYAYRNTLEKKITMQKNVEMENRRGDKIISSELIWDEGKEILYTEKYVRIIQPEQQDTTEGFGFVTDQDFTRFEIKHRGSASLNAEKIKAEFDKK